MSFGQFVAVIVLLLLYFMVRAFNRVAADHAQSTPPAKKRARRSMPVDPIPQRFVVIDFETTGLHAAHHEIIEIGAVKVDTTSDEHQTFQALILPKKRISSKITELTGLDRKRLKAEGIAIEEALPQLLAFCEGLPLVAFNAKFDRGFLDAACLSCALEAPGRWTCALELSRAAWPGLPSYRLSALAERGGLALDNEHRAVSDCTRTMLIYRAAVQELSAT